MRADANLLRRLAKDGLSLRTCTDVPDGPVQTDEVLPPAPRKRPKRALLRRVLLDPLTVVRSCAASLQYSPHNWWMLPIVVSSGADIRCRRGGRLDLGGRLFLGHPWGGNEDFSLPRAGRVAVYIGAHGLFKTGGYVSLFYGARLFVEDGAQLRIGKGSYVNAETVIHCASRIEIGNGCSISWQAQILDSDQHFLKVDGVTRPLKAPVQIGDHVWIGSRATILKGVHVGDGAIVASESVVTRDVPPKSLVAGNPARVIHRDIEWGL